MGIPQPAGQNEELLYVSQWSSEKGTYFEEANIKEVFECYAAELTEEALKSWQHWKNQKVKEDFWHCCREALADYQSSEERTPVADDLITPFVTRHPFHG